VKNSEIEISRCFVAICSAVARRFGRGALSPGASAGSATGALSLHHANGAADAIATFALAGRGLRPASVDVAGSGAFPAVAEGGAAVRSLTLANSGEASAIAISAAFSGAGFGLGL
jgi:hypothetical protein